MFSPFFAFLFPQENQTDDSFINLRLIYSVMHFILEMDACFLKGQEHYHSFRLFVALLYFLTSYLHLFLSLFRLSLFLNRRMLGINLLCCHKGAFTLFFPRPEQLSTYSIKLITQAECIELTLHLTCSKLHLRVFKQPSKSA